ncbi:MAG TPA: c-type cytochrome [Anaerolineales bacterium]|nr:c-type cytochrome [Anaerolineales bacterium]
MKLRRIIFLAVLITILSACNFTLAEDVTPPPGYVAPTPLPTLVLSPALPPNVESGRAIYAEKCAACHGETGLGDGEQGIQLGVTVPAFGLPEVAQSASPAGWFTTVTRGRMDRFMPPFASLNDQERWDVVAYALTLHMTEEQIEAGREIFETKCADCSTEFFEDQTRMSALTGVDLARLVRQGNESVPAFGADLSDDELWAAAAYLRSLSFDYSLDQAQAPASTSTPEAASAPADARTPSADETPVGTEQASTQAEPTTVTREGFGSVSGSVDNQTGADLPSDFKVTLRGYDHSSDPSAGPQEVFSQEATVNEDGTYRFENVEMPLSRLFISEVEFDGITVQSDFGIVKEGVSSLTLSPLVLHEMTDDISLLAMDEVRLFLDYGNTDIQVYGVYSFRNPSDKTIVVELKDGTEIPFIRTPEGTISMGYEALQDSEPFANTDKGLAIPPSDGSYGLIAFTTVPKQDEFEVAQPFELPVSNLSVFLPEGVTAESAALIDGGVQNIQNFNFQVYTAENVEAGETVRFNVSGVPEETSETSSEPAASTTNRNLLVGAGLLGIAFIVAGAWLYMRDRNRIEEKEEGKEDEFDSSENVLDAILALDDLHRAKKISDEAYQKRRTELKEILKGMI